METEKKLRLKQFIFGVITFVILLNLVFSTKNKTKKGMNDYVATFNKIDGVGVGTNVEISGIKVGEVFCAAKGTWGGQLDLLVVVRPVGHNGITQDRYAESLTAQWIDA